MSWVAKLIAKVLSMQLADVIPQIISPAQSAFQKGKCIHDSYLYVQGCIKSLHKNNKPALLFKLDIEKAFDLISWDYLLELLQCLGFTVRWRDWISLLLSMASSSCLLNGDAGPAIIHRQGLRQGDPLLPLLLIIAIDPLHRLLTAAVNLGICTALPGRGTSMRISLYADDAMIFANPIREEVDSLL